MAGVFDLSKVTFIYGLIPITGGWGEGDAITYEQVEPDVVAKMGAGGDVAFSVTGKRLTKVTVKLQSVSPNNAILSTLLNLQREGIGPAPILIQDGANILAAAECMIEGPPKVSIGAEANDFEWTILAANPESVLAGHP